MSDLKLFINGNIIEEKNIDAFLSKEGTIIKTGKSKNLQKEYKDDAKILDLKNQYILPAFNDGHLHYFYYALLKESIDLKDCDTKEDVYNKIRKRAQNLDQNNFITVINYDEEKYGGINKLDRFVLDKLSKNIPILVKRRCLHLAFVNSKALKLAEIDENTPDPEGGKILRDKDGLPNGILQDQAIDVFDDLILEKKKKMFENILKDSFHDFLKYGITSIHSDDFSNKKYRKDILDSYLNLDQNNEIPLDITLQIRISKPEDFEFFNEVKEKVKKAKRLTIGPAKFMFDGSLGGRTAALRKHYTDDSTTKGELLFKQEKLETLIDQTYSLNIQPAVHAIGIKAVDIVSKIYEKMNKKHQKKNLRPIIVHASMIDDKILKRIKKNNIVLSLQPTFISSDYKMADKRLGKRRTQHLYRMRSLNEKNIPLAGSSDAPVEDINPLCGIYAAISRKSPQNKNEKSWHPNEIISIKKALQLYTTGPAYQNFEENKKGLIKNNHLTDFITFKKNPYDLKPEEIINLKVQQVYKEGNLIFEY